jgi:outer membrane protein TolC
MDRRTKCLPLRGSYGLIFFTVTLVLWLDPGRSAAQPRTLDFYITQGLAHSPVLGDLKNQINSNTIDSLLITAGQKPQVGFNGLMYYAPVINGYGYSEPITNISNFTSVVYASQRIFNGKTLAAGYRKTGILNQSLRLTSQIMENGLKKAVTAQYLSACSVSNEKAFSQSLLDLIREEATILKQLADQGLYRQVDYLSLMLELHSQELNLAGLDAQYRKELSTLNILCGIPDTSEVALNTPDIPLSAPAGFSQSPYFRQFQVDSLRIVNEKLLVDQDYKPALRWYTDAGLVNNLPGEIYKNFGLSLGLSLSLPIYDGKQRQLNYHKLDFDERTRLGYASFFRQKYSQQLVQLSGELASVQSMIPRVKEQLALAEEIIRQNKLLVNIGQLSVTDYVTALRNYVAVKNSLNQYQIRALQLINEINYWNQ